MNQLIFTSFILLSIVNIYGLPSSPRQLYNGLSFAVPGFSLMNQGGGQGGPGNLFARATVTRYSIRTTGTVTVTKFRTCTMPPAALMPCVNAPAGRRKRDLSSDHENELDSEIDSVTNAAPAEAEIEPAEVPTQIQPTLSMVLKIGSTLITDQEEVQQYFQDHPPLKEVDQDHDQNQDQDDEPTVTTTGYPRLIIPEGRSDTANEFTTIIYPSADVADELVFSDDHDHGVTTETPVHDDIVSNDDESDDGTTPRNPAIEDQDKLRLGIGGTTTVTSTFNSVQVLTVTATGPMATLTVAYMGCSPPTFPISTSAC